MLLIYLPAVTPRSEYIFELIFKDRLGIPYELTTDVDIFTTYKAEKINYSSSRFNDEFFIQASPLLSENFIKKNDVPVGEKFQNKILFPNDETCKIGFDIFSAIFFLISRYEEYLPFTPDEHGRFKAIDTLAHKNNFLHIPIVDIWLNHFKNLLQQRFPSLKFMSSHFKVIITYDIDVAYKYRGRDLKRICGATIKDLLQFDFKNIYARFLTKFSNNKDPWDTYNYLEELIEHNKLDSIFFFLLGDKSKHDRNLDFRQPLVKHLINSVKSFCEIGIHPSYKSFSFPEKIFIEKKRLEDLSGKNIYKSRQHFLKFTLPDTFNSLIEAGIIEDYSMGFPGLSGFRAGTSVPFYFYDLKNERPTNLKMFPVTFMEDTFMNLKYSHPSQSLEEIYNLIESVKNINGTFISIWHNHTVSETKEYKEWRIVHDRMIQKLLSYLEQ